MPNYPQTLLPLETFRQLISYHPLFFWQLSNAAVAPGTSSLGILREYSWQSSSEAGRQDLREAIATAEQRLREYLNYSVAKHFVIEKRDVPCLLHYPQPYFLTLKEGYVNRIATQSWTLIDVTSDLTFADSDGDGIDDTFTATIADTTTDVSDIAVYFQTSDRYGIYEDTLSAWRIEPVKVKRLDANFIQVKGSSWLLVNPAKYEDFLATNGNDSSTSFDPTVSANFVEQVSIYKRVISDINEVTLESTGCDGTTTNTTLCALIIDGKYGQIKVYTGNIDSCNWVCSCNCEGDTNPHYNLTISYEAGAETIEDWQLIVARLALAELQPRLVVETTANQIISRWQNDRAYQQGFGGGSGEKFQTSQTDLNNEFGTREGHIYAWRRVKHLQLIRSVLIK